MSIEVAKTIIEQLGGNRFTAMTGAKSFCATPKGVRFLIPRAKDGINLVEIKLTDLDLYDVKFVKFVRRHLTSVDIETVSGVYAEDLQQVFTAATGLYTRI